MRSMTGYGRGEGIFQGEEFLVEVRSLNHRYFECSIRMPKQYSYLEEQVRKYVQEYVFRGRVEVNISPQGETGKGRRVKVDKDLALEYYNALKELSHSLGSESPIDLELIVGYPDILLLEEEEPDPETSWQALQKAMAMAMVSLADMRSREGEKLQLDVIHRIGRIEQVISEIKERAPEVVDEFRQGLKQRMTSLLGDEEIDEARLLTEVAFYAEKANITEELVRLSSHLDQFRQTLQEPGAIGRKLDFILQEMFREINTVGSKAGDAQISRSVVEVKSELEKIREQVQNVE